MINTKLAPITPSCVCKCYLKSHCVWPGVGKGSEEDLSSYMLSISTPFGDSSTRLFFEKSPTRPGQSDFPLLELNLELSDTGAENDCS